MRRKSNQRDENPKLAPLVVSGSPALKVGLETRRRAAEPVVRKEVYGLLKKQRIKN